MKSWKVFFLEVAVLFMGALVAAYVISAVLDSRRGVDEVAVDSTVISMGIGSLVASVLMSLVAGWKGWRLKPLMFATALVAVFYAQVGSVVITLAAAISYYGAHSVCLLFCYRFKARVGVEGE